MDMPKLLDFTDLKILRKINAAIHAAGASTAIYEIDGLYLSLVRVRETLAPSSSPTTFVITHEDRLISGFGAVCFNKPHEFLLKSARSAFHHGLNLIPQEEPIDVSYFNVRDDDASFAIFDFGCFSSYMPLEITVQLSDPTSTREFDMIIVGQKIDVPHVPQQVTQNAG